MISVIVYGFTQPSSLTEQIRKDLMDRLPTLHGQHQVNIHFSPGFSEQEYGVTVHVSTNQTNPERVHDIQRVVEGILVGIVSAKKLQVYVTPFEPKQCGSENTWK